MEDQKIEAIYLQTKNPMINGNSTEMKKMSDLYSGTPHKLNIALSGHVYHQASLELLFSLILALIVASISFFNIERSVVIVWYSLFMLVTILRFLLIKCYLKSNKENIALWSSLFTISICIGSFSWGLSGLVLLPYQNPIQLSLIAVVLVGVAASSIPLFSAILSAILAFLLSDLLPIIIHLLSMNSQIYIVLGITISIYLIYLIFLAINQNKIIKNYLSLQFEKNELVKNLIDLKNLNKILTENATHDFLTNLANRACFESNLLQAIYRTQRNKKAVAVLYFDLDKFKNINDTYGHQIGDLLLMEVAKKLRRTLRKTDIPARIGGDEFAVILEDISEPSAISIVAKKIIKVFNKPFKINNLVIKSNVSIGISIYPINGTDVASLIQGADKAMYCVKERGGNNYCFDTRLGAVDNSTMLAVNR